MKILSKPFKNYLCNNKGEVHILEGSKEFYDLEKELNEIKKEGFEGNIEDYAKYKSNAMFVFKIIWNENKKKTFTKRKKVLLLKKEVSQSAKDVTKRTFKMFAGNKNTYISLNTSTVIVEGKNGTKNFFKILDNGNVEVTCSTIVPASEGRIEIELEQ